ncbi:thymidylate kinase [Staphylothermus marinus F1]|uniref:Probable thymidylate kinase n=1 Tax=Staphylothermus marinus (strain ATCC 43588 / DSM 3639 / JCM 9404 / F1) TaxID=399550 RepID=KTHY_STAMF|nr:dTMP kinase [Staphylothermus marinus]A3DM71.1 RecName: Full=Probable thymidylate kinase; AltName: Full=dTMP kinase [Staphylothermus marinus F1]ABN69731.1 thymidylate kinase [Staphylothermus marinus F1]
MSENNGFFLVLEGIDGAGKTSIAFKLRDFLVEKGFNVHYTYEPYNTLYVEALKKKYNEYRDAYLDALTYAADRLVHIRTEILPYLRRGYIVICDRYYYSSAAYQSAQGAPIEWVLEINKYALKPDLTIYLDVDPAIGVKRRKGLNTRFPEYEKLDFLYRVRENYLWLVDKGYMVLVDANREFDKVYRDVEKIVLEHLVF